MGRQKNNFEVRLRVLIYNISYIRVAFVVATLWPATLAEAKGSSSASFSIGGLCADLPEPGSSAICCHPLPLCDIHTSLPCDLSGMPGKKDLADLVRNLHGGALPSTRESLVDDILQIFNDESLQSNLPAILQYDQSKKPRL